MRLNEIKIVDLDRSEWDKKKSDRKKAEYFFTGKKFYIDNKIKETRTPYHFSWCRYDQRNGYRELNEWKYLYGYSPVSVDIDPYYPEGITPNESGYYQYGDLVFVKCSLLEHLRRMEENRRIGTLGGKAALDQFKAKVESEGGKVEETDDWVKNYLP